MSAAQARRVREQAKETQLRWEMALLFGYMKQRPTPENRAAFRDIYARLTSYYTHGGLF